MPKIIQVITAEIVFQVMFCQVLGLNILNKFEVVTYSLSYFILCVWMFYLHACLCTMYIPGTHRGQRGHQISCHYSDRWL